MPLTPEQETQCAVIIDDILRRSDLNTVSAKRIRKGLQERVSYDIAPLKAEINNLINIRFDKLNEEQQQRQTQPEQGANGEERSVGREHADVNGETQTNGEAVKAETNGTTESSASSPSAKKRSEPEQDESELSDVVDTPPPKKKHKQAMSAREEEDDAALAARLQAEENSRSRMRATRGGGTKKRAAPVVKAAKGATKKKKSAKKVNSDDDSEVDQDESGGEKKEVKRTGGFHKPMALSEPLSALLGETELSRPQTVKRIWEYIKAHDLQDPTDKRQIRCDDALRTVFKQDRVHMFTMNKILNQNLYALDE